MNQDVLLFIYFCVLHFFTKTTSASFAVSTKVPVMTRTRTSDSIITLRTGSLAQHATAT